MSVYRCQPLRGDRGESVKASAETEVSEGDLAPSRAARKSDRIVVSDNTFS
jgi:hypothetical protein